MFDFEDRSWLVSVVLLAVLWVMGAVLPVRMVGPQLAAQQHYLTEDDSPEQDAPPPLRHPSIVLPVIVFLCGLGLVAWSVMKRMNDVENGARWTWLSAAAGLAAFWALILVLVTMRLK